MRQGCQEGPLRPGPRHRSVIPPSGSGGPASPGVVDAEHVSPREPAARAREPPCAPVSLQALREARRWTCFRPLSTRQEHNARLPDVRTRFPEGVEDLQARGFTMSLLE